MGAARNGEGGGAPAWLFSFVDLAFLLLIAMTLLANSRTGAPDIGEMIVPRIGEDSVREPTQGMGQVWQLRVHPPAEGQAPFELVLVGGDATEQTGERLELAALKRRLDELAAESRTRPMLAPHEDSRSQDMLDAATALEERWQGRRRALVLRDPAR